MDLSAVSEIPALIILVLSCFFIHGIIKLFKLKQPDSEYPAIDALRGYLSIFIVLYHCTIYFWFKKKGTWVDPPSNFFNEFGEISILLFLMTSGFLFFNLLDRKKGTIINWASFYFERFLKLFPLFLIVVIVIIIVSFSNSNFLLTQSPALFLNDLLHLLSFTIFRTPELNNFTDIWIITANSLFVFKYFWLFYLSLPIIAAVFYKIKTPLSVIIFTAYIIIKILFATDIKFIYLLPFLIGLLASFAINNKDLCETLKKKMFSIVNIIILLLLFSFSKDLNIIISFLLISYFFITIICGNTLFGALKIPSAMYIGKMAYPVYLFHPLLLYFIYALSKDKESMGNYHWLYVIITLLLSLVSSVLAYKFILMPFSKFAKEKAIKRSGSFSAKLAAYSIAVLIVITVFSVNQFYEPKTYCNSFEKETQWHKNVRGGKAHSGNYYYAIDSLNIYSPTVNANLEGFANSRKIYSSVYCSAQNPITNLELITSIKYKDSLIFYQSKNVGSCLYLQNKWLQIEDSITIPRNKNIEKSNVYVYLKSNTKETIFVDDLFIEIK